MSSRTADNVGAKTGPEWVNRPMGWSLLLPPGWWHVPLDARQHQSVKALLDRCLASLPRDRVATLRRELEGELTGLAERAVRNGAVDMYLNVDLKRAQPVAASCLATRIPIGGATTLPAVELAAALGNRPGDEVGVLDVAGMQAARVRRREQVGEVPVGGGTDVPWPDELPITRLDVYVPVPGRQEMLLLSFSTPMDPIADAMVALFDAIAGSLRWKQK